MGDPPATADRTHHRISNDSQWQGVHEALQIDWTAELAERINKVFPAN
jgi:hypothetical protein